MKKVYFFGPKTYKCHLGWDTLLLYTRFIAFLMIWDHQVLGMGVGGVHTYVHMHACVCGCACGCACVWEFPTPLLQGLECQITKNAINLELTVTLIEFFTR